MLDFYAFLWVLTANKKNVTYVPVNKHRISHDIKPCSVFFLFILLYVWSWSFCWLCRKMGNAYLFIPKALSLSSLWVSGSRKKCSGKKKKIWEKGLSIISVMALALPVWLAMPPCSHPNRRGVDYVTRGFSRLCLQAHKLDLLFVVTSAAVKGDSFSQTHFPEACCLALSVCLADWLSTSTTS